MKPEVLAIIPARGGSKGLKNKNILPANGHPLIAYSIQAGLVTTAITRTIVSTDSDSIAGIAKKYGAEVPFMRPEKYAQDLSTDFEVFYHALTWLRENENYLPECIIHLRPTTPVRKVDDIEVCIQKLLQSDADSLRVVSIAPHTPYKMWTIDKDTETLLPLLTVDGIPEPYNEPRQKLPKVYWHTGSLDIIRTTCILEKKSVTGKKILSHIMPEDLAVDIDYMEDFIKAEFMLQSKQGIIKFN